MSRLLYLCFVILVPGCFDATYEQWKVTPDAASSVVSSGSASIGSLNLSSSIISELQKNLETKAGLSLAQAKIITESARKELPTLAGTIVVSSSSEDNSGLNLTDTSEITEISPAIVGGAVKALGSSELNLAAASDRANVAKVIMQSTFASLNGRCTDLSADATVALGKTMVVGAMNHLEDAGLSSTNAAIATEAIAAGSVGALSDAGFSSDNTLDAAKAIVGGVISHIPVASSDQASVGSAISRATYGAVSVINSVASGEDGGISSISALTGASVSGLKDLGVETSQVSTLVGQVTSGSVAALGKAGLTGDNLGSTLNVITGSSLQAVSSNGFGDEAVKESAGAVAGGAVAALSQAGVSASSLASSNVVANIMTGTMASLASTGISGSDIAKTMGSIVGQTVASLGQAGLESTDLKKSVMSNVISGVMSGFKDSGITDVGSVNVAMQNLSKGAASSLSSAGIASGDINAVASFITQTSISRVSDIGISSGDDFKNIISNVTQGMMQGMIALKDSNSLDGNDLQATLSSVTSGAIQAVDTLKTSGHVSASDIGSFSSAIAGAAINGLAYGGTSQKDMEALQSNMVSSMAKTLEDIGVTGDSLTTLTNSMTEAAGSSLAAASAISSGSVASCDSTYSDSLADSAFVSEVQGKTGVICAPINLCPKNRSADSLDYIWILQSGKTQICQLQINTHKIIEDLPAKDTEPPILSIATSAAFLNKSNASAFPISGICKGAENAVPIVLKIGTQLATASKILCNNETWAASLDLSLQAEGDFVISANASDNAGNAALEVALNVRKDTVAPVVTINAPSSAIKKANASAFSLSGSCEGVENGSPVSIKVSNTRVANATCNNKVWSSTIDFSSFQDGSITVTADVSDKASNNAQQAARSIVKDVQIPLLTITAATATAASRIFLNSSNVSAFQVSGICKGAENSVPIVLKIGAQLATASKILCNNETWAASLDLSLQAEGDFVISANASDNAGNAALEATLNVRKDTVPPLVAISTPSSAIKNANASAFSLSGSCNGAENGSAVIIKVSNAIVANATCNTNFWAATIDFSSFQDGSITVTADVSDQASNKAQQASRSIVKDVQVPVLTITSPNIAINSANASAFALAGTCVGAEDNSLVKIKIGQTLVASLSCLNSAWSGSVNFASFSDGNITLTADVADQAGNPSLQASCTVSKDVIVPTVTIASLANAKINSNNSSAFALSGNCSENNLPVFLKVGQTLVASFTCSASVWGGDVDFASVNDGTFNVSAETIDQAGNISLQATYALSKKTTVPYLTISSGDYADSSTASNFYFSGSCTGVDGNIILQYANNILSQNIICTSSSWSYYANIASFSDGYLTITADTIDSFGNAATQVYRTINKDTLAPTSASVAINSGASSTISPNVTLTLSAYDSGSGIGQMYITNTSGCGSDGYWESYSSTKSWTMGQTSGTALVYAAFEDTAGNVSSCVSASINVEVPLSPDTLGGGSLRLWLKPESLGLTDGSYVQIWPDSSGNNHNATQFTAANQPIYGSNHINDHPGIYFNGTGGNNNNAGSYSYMSLGDLSSAFPSAATLLIAASINYDDYYCLFETQNNDSWWSYYHVGYSGTFRQSRLEQIPASGLPNSGVHLFTITSDSSAYKSYLNGGQIVNLTGNYSAGNNYVIGSDPQLNVPQKFFLGDIGEILAYNTVLSNGDQEAAQCYLSNKYGIPLSTSCASYYPVPQAPTNFQATDSGSYVALSWTASSTADFSGYKISRSVDGVNYNEIKILNSQSTSYFDTGVNNQNNYYYKIVAYGAGGVSPAAFVSNILPSSGLVLWLRIDDANPGSTLFMNSNGTTAVAQDGDSVGRWVDSSTGGGDALQSGSNSMPILSTGVLNGHSVLTFDGSNDVLKNSITYPRPYTFTIVARVLSGNKARVLSSPGNNWLLSFWGGDKYSYYAEGWITTGPAAVAGEWLIITGDSGIGGANAAVYANGTQQGLGTANAGPIGLSLGGWDTTEFSNCQIAEVIGYDHQLSAAERQAVEAYLKSKFSLP